MNKLTGEHNQDSDCTLDENLECTICHVDHSGECYICHQHGYHLQDCTVYDNVLTSLSTFEKLQELNIPYSKQNSED